MNFEMADENDLRELRKQEWIDGLDRIVAENELSQSLERAGPESRTNAECSDVMA